MFFFPVYLKTRVPSYCVKKLCNYSAIFFPCCVISPMPPNSSGNMQKQEGRDVLRKWPLEKYLGFGMRVPLNAHSAFFCFIMFLRGSEFEPESPENTMGPL